MLKCKISATCWKHLKMKIIFLDLLWCFAFGFIRIKYIKNQSSSLFCTDVQSSNYFEFKTTIFERNV